MNSHSQEHPDRLKPQYPPEVPDPSDRPEIGNLPQQGGEEQKLPPLKLQDIQSL